jgi:hypothetical protein
VFSKGFQPLDFEEVRKKMATQIFVEECEWGSCYFNEVWATHCEWATTPNERGKALILNHFQKHRENLTLLWSI